MELFVMYKLWWHMCVNAFNCKTCALALPALLIIMMSTWVFCFLCFYHWSASACLRWSAITSSLITERLLGLHVALDVCCACVCLWSTTLSEVSSLPRCKVFYVVEENHIAFLVRWFECRIMWQQLTDNLHVFIVFPDFSCFDISAPILPPQRQLRILSWFSCRSRF